MLDGGSIHYFLKETMALTFAESVQDHIHFKLRITNEKERTCTKWIPKMEWMMLGHTFNHDVYILDLEPYDLII